MANDYQQLLQSVINIAKAAGEGALAYYGLSAEALHVTYKTDHTRITEADLAAHRLVSEGLQALTPDIPVLSEEGTILPWAVRSAWSNYWLTDPLDGTSGFIEKCGEFTVNIALIDHHQPILGVVYVPVLKECYFAALGSGAFKQIGTQNPTVIKTKPINWQAFQVLLGRHLHSPQLPMLFEKLPGASIIRLNSSLKFCWIAEGKGDIYPRFGQTSEWDTAAAQCVLGEAGGAVVDLNGAALQYNAKESLVNTAFVAMGDPAQQSTIIDVVQRVRSEQ